VSLSYQDNDNRVREASHHALKSCAKTVKNALGPHLRSIIGCWVSGMCDPHGPAASAAQNAFASTFTLDKQREVFKFGLKAIFAVSLIPSTSAVSFPAHLQSHSQHICSLIPSTSAVSFPAHLQSHSQHICSLIPEMLSATLTSYLGCVLDFSLHHLY